MKYSSVLLATIAAASASGQVVLSGPGTYTQNFDSLASVGTGIAWTNNLPTALMPGWYSTASTYDADDGTAAVSGQYSYGVTGSGERALGSVALNGALLRYGMQINNASGGAFSSLTLSYTGEQWKSGAAIADVLSFAYSTNATSLNTGTWTSLSPLDFNSPNNSGSGVLNGELAANRSFQSATITGLSWLNGSDVWVRWTHIGNASRDSLSLDDLQMNATPAPEPGTLFALSLAGAALIRRRRRQ